MRGTKTHLEYDPIKSYGKRDCVSIFLIFPRVILVNNSVISDTAYVVINTTSIFFFIEYLHTLKRGPEGPITAVKVYKDSLTIKSELISDLEANYQKTLKDYKIIHEKPLLPNTHHY
jgi:V8-like Glu-specific endopeptidase